MSARTWVIAISATVVVVMTLVTLGYRRQDEHRAVLLGVATGATFGLNSSLISAIGASVGHRGNLFLTWQTYAVIVIGPTSFFLLQNALAAGNLVASQPGLTLTNPLVGVVFGVVAFHQETRRGSSSWPPLSGPFSSAPAPCCSRAQGCCKTTHPPPETPTENPCR